jgi:hypothetical protein
MPLVDTENVLHFWRLFYWLVRKPVRKMVLFGRILMTKRVGGGR